MVKPLVVYKASAGSGKTFTLATEYIKLLIDNPHAYRQILAVTFTNKATAEMKQRILSQLYGIWRGLDSSKQYLDKVCSELNVTPRHASEKAGEALQLLLHNYSYFRVETIDSFFQSILRMLARELELTANLNVSLNDAQVEEQAVDQMIENMKASDLLLQWLLSYIMDNISEDRSWNVIGQIKLFGRNIFHDIYKQKREQLEDINSDNNFFDSYTKMLRQVRTLAEKRIQQIAETFFDTIEAEGLSISDFSGKERGVCSIFIKMQRGIFDESVLTPTVTNAVGNPEKWYTKTSTHAMHIHSLAETSLGTLLRQAVDEQPRQWKLYQSATLTLRHLPQLRLLSSIESKVRELNKQSNRFLLSDTQQLLSDIIDDSDTPFIFEKTGAQLQHIMIDEFQDTSTVQWNNFKILLQETMSHASTNLIVGDVKQSIYRWRSGDWKLLANIQDQFPHPEQNIEIKPLDTNYRSQPNIIRFNNAFFTEAAKNEEVDAYDDVEQKWPKSKQDTGLVDIRLLTSEDYKQRMLDSIADIIRELTAKGVTPNEIAIIVRSNSNIPLIANHLASTLPDLVIVSDEAFRLDASPAIQIIIQALQSLTHPNDMIARAFLAKAFSGKLDGELPKDFVNQRDKLARMPLYELTEKIYELFHIDKMKDQSGYLCAFFDQVSNYVSERTGDIHAFLREWNDNIYSKTIQCPDIDGIRLISIHKSKGLEFNNVIIPFCDWRMEFPDILWCQPKEEPFSQLPLAPIDYSMKGMKGTVYENDYTQEHQQNTVDNLNLLYVAFTRAGHNLFVIGQRNSKSSRAVLLEKVMKAMTLNGAILENKDNEEETLRLTYGTLYKSEEKKEEKNERNPFLQKPILTTAEMEAYQQKISFRQSNKSMEFASIESEDEEAQKSRNYIQLGNVMHNVLANIRTADDVDRALLTLEQEGIIYDEHITRQKLEKLIRQRLSTPKAKEWFSDKWTVYNECTILLPDGDKRRPDRVVTNGSETIVIDFKFGRFREEYRQQVKEYMELLSKMGHSNTKGFIWMVYTNEIIEVV